MTATLTHEKTAEAAAEPQAPAPRQMPRLRSPRWGRLVLAFPVPLAVLLIWHLGVQFGWTLPFGIRMAQLPTPADVGVRLADLFVGGLLPSPFSGEVYQHIWASLVRVAYGFGLAVALAVPFGVILGRSALVMKLFEPTINVIRPIPVTAWAPLALIIIGIGDRSAIFLVFLAAFFPMLISTAAAVAQVPPRLLEAAAMLGMPRWKRMVAVVVPSSIPGIFSGLRVGLGLAWALLVVGEMVGINIGLGAMIFEGRQLNQIDLIMAGMVIIGVLGFLTDRLLTALLKLLSRGRPVLQEVA
ncbi:ABC transporter permease [Nesterenkonia cremea]|uniref:Binding-protein-dependent transport system inner membrane protein n=1 Tax=Nesterenkonia cremea TaxID=1882340 RepID=A0A917ALR9_9MICC|nr:ABC transporter permease [Nesterenkonia cremea]GGE60940.1 binding-protein-dependent transport system inner membrane protein [Nesterenkonia cremea]